MVRRQGPECPRCECPDTEVIGERMVFGQRRERCRCAFCGVDFTAGGLLEQGGPGAQREEPTEMDATTDDEPVPVTYHADPVRCVCPACKARNPPVQSTQTIDGKKVRKHRCACGRRFRSTEG